MPPFFNRLQGLIPPQLYPFRTPTFPNQGVINRSPLDQLNSAYVGQDVGGINDQLNQLGAGNDDYDEYQNLSQQLQNAVKNTPAMNAYQSYIQNPPLPQDYQPGKLSRLAAILGGGVAGFSDPAKGVGLARNILEQPYERALSLYGVRGKGLEQAALAEEKGITNKRLAANEALQRFEQKGKMEETERHNKAVEASKSIRDKIYSDWTNRRGARLEAIPGANLVWFYPDGRKEDTGIASNKLTPEHIMEIQQRNALERIEKTGIQSRMNEDLRQGHRIAFRKYVDDHPNYVYKAIPGGTFLAFDPKNPTNEPFDTGISSGILDVEEVQNNKIQLKETPAGATPRESITTLEPIPGTGWFGTNVGAQKERKTITQPVISEGQYRERALAVLKSSGQPLDEKNIQVVIAKLKAKDAATKR